VGFVAVLPGHIFATNPGAKIRISQSGLNYGTSVAVEILSANIKNWPIPNKNGRKFVIGLGDVDNQASNIRVYYGYFWHLYKDIFYHLLSFASCSLS